MKDACKTACKVCGQVFPLQRLRGHTKAAHGMVITEYKSKFNQHYYDLIEKVLHKCGICEEILLLDGDCIAVHLKNFGHNISHKDYNAKFMTIARRGSKIKEDESIIILGDNVMIEETIDISQDTLIKAKQFSQTQNCQTKSGRLEGFNLLLSKLSVKPSSYPALQTLLKIEDMTKESMLRTAMNFHV